MAYLINNNFAIATKTGTYTLIVSDYMVLGDTTNSNFTLNLPMASGILGKEFIIKNVGVGKLTIDGNSADTIDQQNTIVLANKNNSLNIVSDGNNWQVT